MTIDANSTGREIERLRTELALVRAERLTALGQNENLGNALKSFMRKVDELAADRDRLANVVAAVGKLHQRREFDWTKDGMTHGQTEWPDMCSHDYCRSVWPCPTSAALASADAAQPEEKP